MKIFLVSLLMLILSGCAQIQKALFSPSDIEIYCRRIFNSPDESGDLSTCIRQERDAKNRLAGMTIPPDIEKRCRALSASTGGSYQVMLTCVQSEMRTKNR